MEEEEEIAEHQHKHASSKQEAVEQQTCCSVLDMSEGITVTITEGKAVVKEQPECETITLITAALFCLDVSLLCSPAEEHFSHVAVDRQRSGFGVSAESSVQPER